MARYVFLGKGGLVNADRIVAVSRARSAPVKRLLDAAGPSQVFHLIYGYPRQSVILLDTGHLAVTTLTLEELATLLDSLGE